MTHEANLVWHSQTPSRKRMGSGDLRMHQSCSWNVIKCIKILASCNDVHISGKSSGVLYCEEINNIVIWGTDNVCFEVSLMHNLMYNKALHQFSQ